MAFATLAEVLETAEACVQYAMNDLLEKSAEDLQFFASRCASSVAPSLRRSLPPSIPATPPRL